MRLKRQKRPQPIPISLEQAYFFRSPLFYPNNFIKHPYMTPITNSRGLINRWDLFQTQQFERFYFETLVDDTNLALESILKGRSVTLVSFFTSQMIDIPMCLTRIKFAHSSTASNPRLRLISMLMRHGRRYPVSKAYSVAASNLSYYHLYVQGNSPTSKQWELVYLLFAQRRAYPKQGIWTLSRPQNLLTDSKLETKHGQVYTPNSRLTLDCDWFNELLFREIASYYPTFSLFVQQVNKLKRRHSRGRSGQYEIIWKYVPNYKRLLVVLRWLVRDVQFQRAKTFQQRLEHSLESLLFNRNAHLVYKLRNFVHKFVFQRFRKTLVRTLRTAY